MQDVLDQDQDDDSNQEGLEDKTKDAEEGARLPANIVENVE